MHQSTGTALCAPGIVCAMCAMDESAPGGALPRTRATIAADLVRLGVAAGSCLLVHSSLRSLGWVCGGPVAVVQALLDTVGADGTLVVPAQTPEYTDPAGWRSPPVPESWWPAIRREMPAFDPRLTPSQGMGVIAETVRTWPGARRSAHPTVSFAALGALAADLLREHPLDYGLGDASPLGELYRRGAWVLLLGVGYDRATALHLAQYRRPGHAEEENGAGLRHQALRPGRPRRPGHAEEENGAPVLVDGRREWRRFRDIDFDTGPFEQIGTAFDRAGHVRRGSIGEADARLFPVRLAADFAAEWLRSARVESPSPTSDGINGIRG
jgi:aminoglycoside 3-N-acetyltransferase